MAATPNGSSTSGPGRTPSRTDLPRQDVPRPGETLVIQSPASGERLGEVPIHTADEVHQAIARARMAQAAWGALPVKERCQALRSVRIALVQHADELAHAIARENGKPLQEAMTHDVLPLCDLLAYFETRAPRILAPQKIPLHFMVHRRSYLHCVPRGVVGVIGPWNFPLSIPVGDAVLALFAGNAVVVKPSEITPLVVLRFKALWDDVCRQEPRLRPDLFTVVTGRGPTGAALVTGGVDQVMFTGSVPTGRRVAVACAEQLIPCVLELGGINPAIVTADADLERTAHALVWGGFANSGQVCASISRVYVDKRVAEPLIAKVVAQVQALRQGDPESADTDLGVMTFQPQIGIGQDILQDAVNQGARIRTGGTVDGRKFAPTVVDQVQHGWRITQEESFAPLLAFVSVDGEDEALRMANDSDKGLMAYVFTGNDQHGRDLAEKLEAGTSMVNVCIDTHAMPGTPWQGMKQSGLGQVHSAQGLRDLSQVRHVHGRNRLPWLKKELWWYPYSPKVYDGFVQLMKVWWGGGAIDKVLRALGK
jgi:acyl-CoA reductase-like NAD-dependent aldehyde dehydrogenase